MRELVTTNPGAALVVTILLGLGGILLMTVLMSLARRVVRAWRRRLQEALDRELFGHSMTEMRARRTRIQLTTGKPPGRWNPRW
ncbi:hypothetical protein [Goodfellowiella coeruleoviolacea]|uniref:Uncharacterized protein n=1 Tax=Goodfellowiella coeruleoviolacea TaxID=334858 RepID=A0AAE3G9P4_9PSEU|nr:hypothetical protein [Goodfellowiella coeruleoviolacea]MCP2164237.1 hypothetical protein [Goodfellowiella coeruleoviolacea]